MAASDKGTDYIKNVLLCRGHPHTPFATPQQFSTLGSILPFAAVVSSGRNGPFVIVMAEGSGPIAAPGTFRH